MALRAGAAPDRPSRPPTDARAIHVRQSRLEETVAVIASNFGQHRHPAWYHNLRAHPHAEVIVDGVGRSVLAVEGDGERRSEIWQQGLRVYPGFSQYERRAPHRQISVFVLQPS